jgi:hypothetical protein
MKRYLPAAVACLLVLVCGVVHGFWTDRWRPPAETAAAAARMADLPLRLGDWDGQDLELKGTQPGGTAGALERKYVNRRTGEALTIYLVCGRPGPVAIHTPDVCYGSSGYEIGPRSKAGPRDGGEFWTADASRSTATDETRLRVYWAWNAGGGWSAPDDARLAFVRAPVLYKLYVQRELTGEGRAAQEEPCLAFLRVLLPELDRALFAPGS